jgi:tetratricopeptide (TPR) repeat protein
MRLFSKKALYLALFMVVAAGVQSFADMETYLENTRAALAELEAELAEKEAALADAKAVLLDAKAGIAEAEAAYAEAEADLTNTKTTIEIMKEALAELEASSDTVASDGTETPAATGEPSTTTASTTTPAAGEASTTTTGTTTPAATGEASTGTATPTVSGGSSTGTATATADTTPAPITPTDRGDIPDSIRRNQYYLESERYLALAQESYNGGDYDAATKYAEEAARLARLSDEYITWQTEGSGVLPAIYTVREWDVHGDCFWNIAGYPWVYNDPHRWRTLYEANKAKLPNPNNPNLVEPGTVLTIPSIKGETRQGSWVSGGTYEPLR